MNRRNFLASVAVGGLSVAGLSGDRDSGPGDETPSLNLGDQGLKPGTLDETGGGRQDFLSPASKAVQKLGGRSLPELRAYFRKEVDNEVIAYWDKYGVDREYGGFLKADKKTGAYPTTDKDLYSQGRILWIYSYLYNHFGRNQAHLDAARQGKEALVKHALLPDGHWGTLYARDWKMKQGFFDIYADIYMVLGLAEYFKASGDENARDLAVRTSYLVTETILAPHYQGQGHGPAYEPGIKRLGTWVHFLFPLTYLLQYTKDEGLEAVARMCVRNMLQYHWVRGEGFAYECLDNQYRPYSSDYLSRFDNNLGYRLEFISGWHNIQAAFKVMLEALRLGSREMFRDGLEFGFQICRTHWKDSEPGGFYDFMKVDDLRQGRGVESKADSAIYDFLVFALLAVEYTMSAESIAWFEKIFACSLSRPIYNGSLTLHEPRGVMFGLQIVERMIERAGRVSGFLS
jgi:GNAT superfamily N-acetyltransferase